MAEVVWTHTARNHLKNILEFIALGSKKYAIATVERIQRSAARLGRFPESGRWVPEDKTNTYREVVVGNYRVIYRTAPGVVYVVGVMHGAQAFRMPEA